VRMHKSTLFDLMKTGYPTHQWEAWKFEFDPLHRWTAKASPSELPSFLQYLANSLNITPTDFDAWYSVKSVQLRPRLASAIWVLGGLPSLLQRMYPNHQWNSSRFAWIGKRSAQKGVVSTLHEWISPKGTTTNSSAKGLTLVRT